MSLRKMASYVFGEAVTGGQIAFFTLALGAAVYFPTKVPYIGFYPGALQHSLGPLNMHTVIMHVMPCDLGVLTS